MDSFSEFQRLNIALQKLVHRSCSRENIRERYARINLNFDFDFLIFFYCI